MFSLSRHPNNPLLTPNPENDWERMAAFNGSLLWDADLALLAYRAMSTEQNIEGRTLPLSVIGLAESRDGLNFSNRQKLITPSETWDKFGCEDPRIVKIEDDYIITYTGLSDWPPHPGAIKIGVSIGKSLNKLGKHLLTPFNSKAMAFFPEKVNGKYVALLTVHTDLPPSYICLAWFDKLEDAWSPDYWHDWYKTLPTHVLPLSRLSSDQLEVGAVPLKIDQGFLVFYAHIQHYYSETKRVFGIQALLLDAVNPGNILRRTPGPILVPGAPYEMNGQVAKVVFPTGGSVKGDRVSLYYGAGDSTTCMASGSLSDLLSGMPEKGIIVPKADRPIGRPLLLPWADHDWEAKAVFNPAAYDDGKTIHLLYRAMSPTNRSVFGYAATTSGFDILERSEMPAYEPRARFEIAQKLGVNYGCEDPRLTRIDDTLYLCYTAYNGQDPPRVAISSIGVQDFVGHDFSLWSDPLLISPPGIDDKDAALFPERIHGKYVFLHRIQGSIVFDMVDSLDYFDGRTNWLRSMAFIPPHEEDWDNEKIGACAPPLKTEKGWLLFYHGVSRKSFVYRVGAMLLDLDEPTRVLAHSAWPLLEPVLPFEKQGIVSNVVFPCGNILRGDTIYLYYGSADQTVGVATISLLTLLDYLLEAPHHGSSGRERSQDHVEMGGEDK